MPCRNTIDMAPMPEALPSEGPEKPQFAISHQKVALDIDLASRSLKGETEITVIPQNKDLTFIRLNCRQCDLKRVIVNGKVAPNVFYENLYADPILHYRATVYSYWRLQNKIDRRPVDKISEELIIRLSKSVKIEELRDVTDDTSFPRTQTASKTEPYIRPVQGSEVEYSQTARAGFETTVRFTPITVTIEYEIKDLRDGMQFVGLAEGDLRYPHAYTTDFSLPGTASCIFPCIDKLTSRCNWEILVTYPATIGDAFKRSENKDAIPKKLSGESDELSNPNRLDDYRDEDKLLEFRAICSGQMNYDSSDVTGYGKRTISFICPSTSAQHINFVIGPMEKVDLARYRESDEDDRLGQNAVPVHAYCLPGRASDVANTCLPLAKAVDYFTMTYGSYPFSDYQLCFVDDVYPDILHGSGLSICSNGLLFSEDVIDPIDTVTRQLVHAIASQWVGIHIIPREPEDTWVIVGIAYYMTDMFIRKLCGNNHYRYYQKQACDRTVEMDVRRPTLLDIGRYLALDPGELEFMALKAPLVLFILDQRLKKSGNSGMSRIISRLLLTAKTEELLDGAISHSHFVRTCERLGHAKLDKFFEQWVEGAGCPRFLVTQKFNKKKLVVEMLIMQEQTEKEEDRPEKDLESKSFMRELREDAEGVYAGAPQPLFTGPMTIRIHEADGTPYEHIVDIKQRRQNVEIPYNTKYKRLKRTRRRKERTLANVGAEYAAEGMDDVLVYSLGDALSGEEIEKEWNITGWSQHQVEEMELESYEWIRMDCDFEWIAKMHLHMPGYMWVSQLEQDRDIVAQHQTMQYLETLKPHRLISSICIKTLMDHRYFHGIRTMAAAILSKHAKEDVDWIGQFHLEKAFKELFCYSDSSMIRPNDFVDRKLYYIQCAIPRAISRIRGSDGRSPMSARTFLLEKLRFNDNSGNLRSDSHYIAVLMHGLAEAVASAPPPANPDLDDFTGDDPRFQTACLEEIDRYRRIDEWIPSHHNILTTTALECNALLVRAGTIPLTVATFLEYTGDANSADVRLSAFANLMSLGVFTKAPIARWFLFMLSNDPSPSVREGMLAILGKALGSLAIGEIVHPQAVTGLNGTQESGNLIIEQDADTAGRAEDIKRRQSIEGAKEALRLELDNEVFRIELWNAIQSPQISLKQMNELLQLCDWLYYRSHSGEMNGDTSVHNPCNNVLVTLKYPRYWTCRTSGKGQITFTASGSVRTKPTPQWTPPSQQKAANTNQPMKKEDEPFKTAAVPKRTFIKPPKPKKPVLQDMPSSPFIESAPASGRMTPSTPSSEHGSEQKQKIKLVFKKKDGGGAASPST